MNIVITNELLFYRKTVDLNLNDNNLYKILQWSINRITNINELIHSDYKFIWVKPSESTLKSINYDKGNKSDLTQNHNINNYNLF